MKLYRLRLAWWAFRNPDRLTMLRYDLMRNGRNTIKSGLKVNGRTVWQDRHPAAALDAQRYAEYLATMPKDWTRPGDAP